MKATLYMSDQKSAVANFDEVKIIEMNDNHKMAPYRITFKAEGLNSSSTMLELHRDANMRLELEDGRACEVIVQHTSLDMQGNAIGVLRVLGGLAS